jgi:hypothetical protein
LKLDPGGWYARNAGNKRGKSCDKGVQDRWPLRGARHCP